ncbi:sulfatase [Bacteroidota bacterium]
MNIRRLKYIQIAFLLLLLTSCGKESSHRLVQHPNVLLICIDDLRPDLGCYGNEIIQTPNIDKLASTAAVFSHHYVQTAICGPSRTTLLTGKIQQVWDLWSDMRVKGIEPDMPFVLPHLFKRNGYNTVCIGKITHEPGGVMDEEQMIPQIPFAWDTTYTSVGKWETPWRAFFAFANGDAHNTAMRIGMDSPRIPYESGIVDDNGYPDGLNADEAVLQLGKLKKEGNPFFLAVGFYKPHLPFNAPQKYWDLYERDKIPDAVNNFFPKNIIKEYSIQNSVEITTHYPWPDGPGIITPEKATDLKHAYYACVSYIDAQIEKILLELAELGLDQNTIVVLWSDHGWHLGEHGIFGKMTNFDIATNSPLIIRVPGITEGGKVVNGLVETVDIYPTLAELCGLDYPSDLDGQSVTHLLRNPDAKGKPYARSFYYRNNALGKSIRTDRYRIVHWTTENDSTVAIELYDHFTDPEENINIAADEKEVTAHLLKQLDSLKFFDPGNEFLTGWE